MIPNNYQASTHQVSPLKRKGQKHIGQHLRGQLFQEFPNPKALLYKQRPAPIWIL
jgi:hypothetical protein